ncbi:unnamed protein product [Arctogadus glacialis]
MKKGAAVLLHFWLELCRLSVLHAGEMEDKIRWRVALVHSLCVSVSFSRSLDLALLNVLWISGSLSLPLLPNFRLHSTIELQKALYCRQEYQGRDLSVPLIVPPRTLDCCVPPLVAV